MNDKEIDQALAHAAQDSHPVEPALLKSIADSIESPMRPVRPLAPTWQLAGGLILVCAFVAISGAALGGFHGIEKLDLLRRMLIFCALAAITFAAAGEFIGQMIPGSKVTLTPAALLQTSSVALLALFALLFRDYATTLFLHAGLVCLSVGLLYAVPAGVLCWWLLRCGFAVDSISAGLAAGMLGGLAGLTMLELHCDNFQALHIIIWHTSVVPASAAAGALIAWALRPRL